MVFFHALVEIQPGWSHRDSRATGGSLTKFAIGYLLATVLAVEAAVLHNFLWHESYTWVERATGGTAASLARLLRFNLTTGAVSIGGNLLMMRLLVGGSHWNPMFANMISIAICSLANFLISDCWVFRAAQRSERLVIPRSAAPRNLLSPGFNN